MKFLVRLISVFCPFVIVSAATAQDAWPPAGRNITFVVPYGPGGYTDLVGRLTARFVEEETGRIVVVENRAGGGGIVGTQSVVRSTPDGSVFCVCSVGAISIAPFAQKVGYDPVNDLAPVSIVSSISQAVIVKLELPVKSMSELVAYAKANPGKLNYGSSGLGGLTNYSVELFQARTGTKLVHVPYKGGAESVMALVAKTIDLSFANMTDALPQVEANTVRLIGVTSLERSPYFPQIPTVHETVSPNFLAETWNGIMAPAATPQPVIQRMAQILSKMADQAGIRETMRKAGAVLVKSTPEQFRTQINGEIEQWKPLLAEIAARKEN